MTIKVVSNTPLPRRGRYEKVSFDYIDFHKFYMPGVYVFYMGSEAVYVGSGKKVMGRCMGTHHRENVRAVATHVVIHPCPTHEMARRLEQKMIYYLKPIGYVGYI